MGYPSHTGKSFFPLDVEEDYQMKGYEAGSADVNHRVQI